MTTPAKQMKQPLLIEDVPSDEDKFQSHQKIADALSELIDKQAGGKTIGLEGSWGAGKSTIIRLFTNALSKPPYDRPVLIYNFDAWAHQGDPLRRAFLEGLIDQCLEKKWVGDLAVPKLDSNQDWEDEKARLARRMKESKKLTIPVLTPMGKILLPSLLLLPIGWGLLTGAFKEGSPGWLLILGLLLTAAPILIFLYFYLFATRKDSAKKEQLLAIFYQKMSTAESTTTIETSEPTTLEFQNVFKKLLSVALTNPERRFVIVLDNLDRISTEESAGVWSMLRSFIDNPIIRKETWFKQIWVLIPYAPDGLVADSTGDASGAPDNVVSGRDTDDLVKNSLPPREHFLEKVIQIKFYVPGPVLSNWKQYLAELLQKAFPYEQGNSAFHKIYLLCANELARTTPPGPRELVTLVNDIVATELQWQGTIPLEHQALFAILKRNGIKIRENLISRKIPSAKQIALLGVELSDSLASLTFNVDADKAKQILLQPLIKDALLDSSGKKLKDEYHSRPGFSELFDIDFGVLLPEFVAGDQASLVTCILSVQASGILENAKLDSRLEIKKEIGRAIQNTSFWPLQDGRVLEALVAVAQIDSEGFMREALGNSLKKTETWFSTSKNFGFVPKEIDGYKPILQLISNVWRNQQLREYFKDNWPMPPVTIPCEPQRWVEICDFVQESNPSLDFKAIKPGIPMADIVSFLKSAIETGTVSAPIYNSLLSYVNADELEHFGPIVEASLQQLSTLSTTSPQSTLNIYRFLQFASKILPTAASALKKNVESGAVLHTVWLGFTTSTEGFSISAKSLTAWSLYIWLREQPAGTLGATVANSAEGHALAVAFFNSPSSSPALVTALFDLAKQFDSDALVFRMAWLNGPTAPLAAYVVSQATEKNDIAVLVGEGDVVRRVVFITQSMHAAQKNTAPLIAYLNERIETGNFVIELTESTFDLRLLPFYAFLMDNTSIRSNRLFPEWCQKALQSVSREVLASDLVSSGPWTKLIIALAANSTPPQLGPEFRGALADFSSKTLGGLVPPDGAIRPPSSINLFQALLPDLLDGLVDEIYEMAANNAGREIAEGFFLLVGEVLIAKGVLSDASNKVIRRLVLPLIETANVPGITWIANAINRDRTIIDNADDVAVRDLLSKLEDCLKLDTRPLEMKYLFESIRILRPEMKTAGSVDTPPPQNTADTPA